MESTIQRRIIRYLEAKDAYVIKLISTSKSGNPDIIACWHGMFIAFEVKDVGKVPTELQQYKLSKIRSAGGKAFAVSSLEDCITIMEMIQDAV